ncbi:hypothetical protein ACFYOC_20075 [Nocardiopsis alba]|uniref:Uncharacterized protein n=1 Tax=Nocardiopsis alba TaxID=53437 RepID=A0A7K2IZY0_9ACTN|nr:MULTISPECIES: hypothetical protein [Nocardiopsis]MEC3891256.1 hypothetical protein [Nocardiopsis sp. LDBS1602]MYR35387.1 hypothetical protein [Nocardiopsis alba]
MEAERSRGQHAALLCGLDECDADTYTLPGLPALPHRLDANDNPDGGVGRSR